MPRTMRTFEVVAKEWNDERPEYRRPGLELLPRELWRLHVRGDLLCVSTHGQFTPPSEREPEGSWFRVWFRAALVPGDSRQGFEAFDDLERQEEPPLAIFDTVDDRAIV